MHGCDTDFSLIMKFRDSRKVIAKIKVKAFYKNIYAKNPLGKLNSRDSRELYTINRNWVVQP